MNLTCIFFGLFFIIYGLIFTFGKAHIHLTSWQRLSSDEQNAIKIEPLCRNIGNVIILCGLIFLARGLWRDFSSHWFSICITAWLIVAALDVWFVNHSKHYVHK